MLDGLILKRTGGFPSLVILDAESASGVASYMPPSTCFGGYGRKMQRIPFGLVIQNLQNYHLTVLYNITTSARLHSKLFK